MFADYPPTRPKSVLPVQFGTVSSLNREPPLSIEFVRPSPASSRTLVTRLPDSRTIGFSPLFPQNALMPRFINKTISWRRPLRRLYLQVIILLGCSLTLLADTPALLRSVPEGGCYCHCAESHLRGGCVKMCDSKRYVSRWRATKCAKPHMQTPTHNSHAGPRFPHPDRAEHAQL